MWALTKAMGDRIVAAVDNRNLENVFRPASSESGLGPAGVVEFDVAEAVRLAAVQAPDGTTYTWAALGASHPTPTQSVADCRRAIKELVGTLTMTRAWWVGDKLHLARPPTGTTLVDAKKVVAAKTASHYLPMMSSLVVAFTWVAFLAWCSLRMSVVPGGAGD
jgi:hypothetical protein